MINLTSNMFYAISTITSIRVMSKIVNYLKIRVNDILKNLVHREITMLGNLYLYFLVKINLRRSLEYVKKLKVSNKLKLNITLLS